MRVRSIVACVALSLGVGACARSNVVTSSESARQPRVLLVSLDGFRWDYIQRPGAVRLRELAARGVRAEALVPSFPSKTFPNHYTIVTGLRPAEHGIVANAIYDSTLGRFRTSDAAAQRDARWWGGEPIWVTAKRQGLRTASMFWPGSEAAIGGWPLDWTSRYEHTFPRAERVTRVLDWLALPPDSAPHFIAMYLADLDDAGHDFGPDAPQVDSALVKVDSVIGALIDGIRRLALTDVVNIIVVSDHGMTETSSRRLIVLDSLIDLATIDVIDWTPVAAIVPRDGDVERVYRALYGRHPHLQVYKKREVPARWAFDDHPRITPIVAVADEGWTIVSRAQVERRRALAPRDTMWIGGQHGYDPALRSMGALFIAAGPGIAEGRVVPAFGNLHVYPLMAHLLGVRAARTSGQLDSVAMVLRR